MFCVQNMGLSSKQVSGGDAFDWVKSLMQGGALQLPKINQVHQQQQQQQQQQQRQQQQQQQQLEPLKCPRCDSSNTKFCYYNNYNRSQPRHFCKSCRRHWTKGGTLRNVPVGGGRKNKRIKTSGTTSIRTTTTASGSSSGSGSGGRSANVNCLDVSKSNGNLAVLPLEHLPSLATFGDHDDQKNIPHEILYQSLQQPTSIQPDYTTDGNSDEISSNFMAESLMPLLDNSLLPLPTFSTINSSSSTSSFSGCFESLPNVLNYAGRTGMFEYPSVPQMPLSLPATRSLMDSSSYWNWEDLNSLTSTDHQKQLWDDS